METATVASPGLPRSCQIISVITNLFSLMTVLAVLLLAVPHHLRCLAELGWRLPACSQLTADASHWMSVSWYLAAPLLLILIGLPFITSRRFPALTTLYGILLPVLFLTLAGLALWFITFPYLTADHRLS